MHNPSQAPTQPCILTPDEARQRAACLVALKDALGERGIDSVLASRHRLVLHGNGPWEPPRNGDPELYVFTPHGPDIVTTDGQDYRLSSGLTHPACDPAGIADLIDRQAFHL